MNEFYKFCIKIISLVSSLVVLVSHYKLSFCIVYQFQQNIHFRNLVNFLISFIPRTLEMFSGIVECEYCDEKYSAYSLGVSLPTSSQSFSVFKSTCLEQFSPVFFC